MTYSWTQQTLPASQHWGAIAYGNGTFVAIGSDVSEQVATSPDGITWTARPSIPPSSSQHISVVYGNGIFIAGGVGAFAATSPDGITWTQRTMPVWGNWIIAYGNGIYAAISNASTNTAVSSDGITWVAHTLPFTPGIAQLIFANGIFVAVGGNVGTSIPCGFTSTDGITWTQRSMPSVSSGDYTSVAYGNSTFVALGGSGTAAATSPDGVTWTAQTLPVSAIWITIAYGNGVFVAVGNSSTISAISPDGITWTQLTLTTNMSWSCSCYGNNVILVSGFGTVVELLSTTILGVNFNSSGSTNNVNYVEVWDSNVFIDGLMFNDANPNSKCTVICQKNTSTALTVSNCSITGQAQTAIKTNDSVAACMIRPGNTGKFSMYNCVVYDRQGHADAANVIIVQPYSIFALVNCSFSAYPSDFPAFTTTNGAIIYQDAVDNAALGGGATGIYAGIIRNTAVFGYSTPFHTYNIDHCVFAGSSVGSSTGSYSGTGPVDVSGNLFSKLLASNFTSISNARIITGSDCINAGVTDLTDVTTDDDIAHRKRPFTSANWSIGAFEW